MEIREINTYSDFISLKGAWEDVLTRCDHTIFSTWEWLSIWWKHFGKNKKLFLLLAEENGKIVGIAPLMYLVERMFGLRIGKIAFLGSPHSDYNDFIVEEGRSDCIPSFIDYLKGIQEKWNYIELADIPQNSKSLSSLTEITKTPKPDHICPYFTLPKTYDLFLSGLSRNLRYDLRRDLRRMEKNHKVEFADYSGVQSVAEGMQTLFDLHQKRWESIGLPGAFTDPKFRHFHLEAARSLAQRGWLGLFLLKLSEKPVGALYGFKYRAKFCVYLPGFDPKYSKYGIGNLLVAHAVDKCIEEGFAEFDLMRGEESYKKRWKTVSRMNRRVIIVNDNLLSNAQNWFYQKYWYQGKKLKSLLNM